MTAINISELTGFPRTVRVVMPHQTKANQTFTADINVKFAHMDDDEHMELFAVDPVTKKLVHTQREICDHIITWVKPEDVKGAESSEQAKQAIIRVIAIQNAMIDDFSECQSGFARKNSRG